MEQQFDRVSLEEGRKLFKKYFGKGNRVNKYHAVKTEIDGITFDSKKEAAFYWELKMRQRAGEIKHFEVKPKIEIQPAFVLPNGEKVGAIVYIPDYVINHNDGVVEIVDVKGMVTEVFKIKWKMLKYLLRAGAKYKFTIR